MKRFLALLISVLMALSLVTIPVFAENTDHETSKVNPGSAVAVKPNDAEILDEALNVPGGTLTFVSDGDYPWEIYEDGARSTNMGVSSSESSVKTTVEATVGGEVLRFDFMSFGEGGSYDILQLFIDDERVEYWARVEEVETFGYPLTVGTHEVRWTYKKDGSVDKPGDYAWLDNVYIGERTMPEEIIVDDVTVPAGRRTYSSYTVLPEDAYNNNATYSTADASIATVDENGVVYGVAEGTTTLIVTAVDGGAYGTATITVTEALPTVNLYGYMCFSNELQVFPNYWGTFADYDPSIVTELDSAPITYAAASAGNMIYGYNQSGEFYRIDPTQGMVPEYLGFTTGYTIVDMDRDHVRYLYRRC